MRSPRSILFWDAICDTFWLLGVIGGAAFVSIALFAIGLIILCRVL